MPSNTLPTAAPMALNIPITDDNAVIASSFFLKASVKFLTALTTMTRATPIAATIAPIGLAINFNVAFNSDITPLVALFRAEPSPVAAPACAVSAAAAVLLAAALVLVAVLKPIVLRVAPSVAADWALVAVVCAVVASVAALVAVAAAPVAVALALTAAVACVVALAASVMGFLNPIVVRLAFSNVVPIPLKASPRPFSLAICASKSKTPFIMPPNFSILEIGASQMLW